MFPCTHLSLPIAGSRAIRHFLAALCTALLLGPVFALAQGEEPYYGWIGDYTGDEPNTLMLWKFDEPTYGLDSSGHSRGANFAAEGATTGVPGRFGQAFRSEVTTDTSGSTGNDSFAQGGSNSVEAFDGSALSVEFWFRPVSTTPGAATGWSFLFDKRFTNPGGIMMRFNTDTGLRVDVHNGTALRFLATGALTWEPGQWYHIATTYDAATGALRIFRDGRRIAQSTDSAYGMLAETTVQWRLANRLGSSFGSVPGDYDNFRVSNVAYNYAVPPHAGPYFGWMEDYAGDEPGTILLWKFESPSTADSSPNNYYAVYPSGGGYSTGIPGRFGNGFRSEVTEGTSGSGGNDSYAQGTFTSAEAFDTSNLTVDFWFRPVSEVPGDATQWSVLVDKRYTGPAGFTLLFNSSTSLRAYVGNGERLINATSGEIDWVAGEWYHLAVTYRAETGALRLYRNGRLLVETRDEEFGELVNSPHVWRLANRLGSSYGSVPGDYDNFRLSAHVYEFATFPAETPFDLWREAHFTGAELENKAISGAAGDPSGDGVSNLLKFVLGLDPRIPARGSLPVAELVDGALQLTYAHAHQASAATVTAEISTDLLNWDSGPAYTEVLQIVQEGERDWITIRAIPNGEERLFLRLLLELQD